MSDDRNILAGMRSPNGAHRLAAAERLMLAPDLARQFAIELAMMVGDQEESVREAAVAALEEVEAPDPGKVIPLTALLQDERGDVSYWAATLLGRLGEAAGHAVPALIEAAGGKNGDGLATSARQRAIWALGKIGLAAASAKRVLQTAAEDSDPRTARLAQRALNQIE